MKQKRLFSGLLLGFAGIWAIGLLLFAFAFAACKSDTIPPKENQTPVASDYVISGSWNQIAGYVTAINITPKPNKSSGAITIKYNDSIDLPQTADSYAVTFNVAATSGWNAAANLPAGTLTVEQPKPTELIYKIYSNGTLTSGFTVTTDSSPHNLQANPNGGHDGHSQALGVNDGGWGGRFLSIRANNASTVNWSTVDALSFWMKGDNILVNSIGLLDDVREGNDPLNIEYKGENGDDGFTITNTWTRYVLPIPNNAANGISTRTEIFKLFLGHGDAKVVYVDDIELISANKIFSIEIPNTGSMNSGTASAYSLTGTFKARYTVDNKSNILLFSNLVKFGNWFSNYSFTANNGASINGDNVTASSNFTLNVTFGGVTSNNMAVTVSGGDEPGPVNPGDPSANLPYDPTIPQRPDNKMFFQFNNQTNGAYADNQIYVLILGKDLNDANPRPWKYVNSSGNFVSISADMLPGPHPNPPKHTTAMSFKMSDGANSSAGKKYVYMPNIESGRMFISYGQPLSIGWVYGADGLLGFAGPDLNNTGDPNYNIHFEFLEFTIEATPNENGAGIYNRYHGNTTRVDFFDFPMVTTLHSKRGAYTVGEIGTRDSIRNAWQNEVPNEFKGLRETMRILAPAKRNFNEGQPQGNYFDGYVNELWNAWRNAGNNNVVFNCGDAGTIRGTMGADNILRMVRDGHNGDANWGNIIIRKPTTQDVFEGKGTLAYAEGSVTGSLAIQAQLCAAINRGVAHLGVWNNESQFYNTGKPANHYAAFWHNHSINRHAYGFCYDDVFDWATLLVGENPIALVMDLKWN